MIADNSCPFGSIVREALLLFVRICIDIMVIDSYYLSSSLVIDYFPVFLDYVNIIYAAHYLVGLLVLFRHYDGACSWLVKIVC